MKAFDYKCQAPFGVQFLLLSFDGAKELKIMIDTMDIIFDSVEATNFTPNQSRMLHDIRDRLKDNLERLQLEHVNDL